MWGPTSLLCQSVILTTTATTLDIVTGMPLIEEVQEDEAGPSMSGPSFGVVMRELAARLALPEDLLTSYMGGDMREYHAGN